MWSNLFIAHSEHKDRDSENYSDLFFWKTCMRSMYIGDVRILDLNQFKKSEHYQFFVGYEAYQLLLKIVSGVKSKLLGETEISSQFKENFQNAKLPKNSIGEYLMKLRDQIIEDSRKIRSNYLRGLGDQSYGGIANKYLKPESNISILGTGNLTRKIIPWLLEKKRNVTVFGRDIEKLNELQKEFSVNTELISVFSPKENESLVVSAPVPIKNFFDNKNISHQIIDFRENNFEENFSENINYISFASILSALNVQEERNKLLREKLEIVIKEISDERENQSINFFYGWEDIPCYQN